MNSNMSFFAFVPARGGSKGIAKKNLHILNKKPLIHYTLDAAQKSQYISEVYVSSDCETTLKFTKNYKNIHNIRRPDEFACDDSLANDVIKNFIQTTFKTVTQSLYMVYLQPTSPLRNEKHIDAAIKLLSKSNSRSLVSVKESSEIPYKSLKIEKGLLQSIFNKDLLNANRQNLEATFYPNGAIYIFNVNDFIANNFKIPMTNSLPYIMPNRESIDIDTKIDLEIASSLLLKK